MITVYIDLELLVPGKTGTRSHPVVSIGNYAEETIITFAHQINGELEFATVSTASRFFKGVSVL